jgi:phosphate transport system substrate-binding protein
VRPTGRIARLAAASLLSLLLLCGAWTAGAFAETLHIGGAGDAVGGVAQAAEAFRKERPEVRVVFSGSMGNTSAIRAVLAGKLDIALSSRPLVPEERARGGRETPYARTAIVFAVHPGVPVSGVTLFDVADILEGTTHRWEDGTPVRVVLRHHSTPAGAAELEKAIPELAVAHRSAHGREGMIVARTEKECVDRIEKTPGAFGITALSLVISEKRRVKILAVEGIAPAVDSVRDGSYRYTRTFRAVTGPSPSAAAAEFIRFLRTRKALAVLLENGHAELP